MVDPSLLNRITPQLSYPSTGYLAVIQGSKICHGPIIQPAPAPDADCTMSKHACRLPCISPHSVRWNLFGPRIQMQMQPSMHVLFACVTAPTPVHVPLSLTLPLAPPGDTPVVDGRLGSSMVVLLAPMTDA